MISSLSEFLGVMTYLSGKVYKDLFIELNRDKTYAIISIFQNNFIGGLGIEHRALIRVTDDQSELKS